MKRNFSKLSDHFFYLYTMIKYFLKFNKDICQNRMMLPVLILIGRMFIVICTLSVLSCNYVAGQDPGKFILPDHPRLIFNRSDETKLIQKVVENKYIEVLHNVILDSADKMIHEKPVIYEKTGRRLLKVSRTCLKRVLFLAYSYRLTNDRKYLKRAEKEMLTVAKFKDWNPDHFLDVAEMTAALAIGYDWLYYDLDKKSRAKIENAIIRKGLLPSRNDKYTRVPSVAGVPEAKLLLSCFFSKAVFSTIFCQRRAPFLLS